MRNLINSIIILSVLSLFSLWLFQVQYSKNYESKRSVEDISAQEQFRMLECLVENIYYETAGEKIEGKIGVGQVTLSRLSDKKKRFSTDLCKTVHQKNQFSWTMEKPKALVKIDKQAYENSRYVAKKVLFEGERIDCIGDSLYYHSIKIKPRWDYTKIKQTCTVGNHVYYKDAKS